jgi:hypothetical protein
MLHPRPVPIIDEHRAHRWPADGDQVVLGIISQSIALRAHRTSPLTPILAGGVHRTAPKCGIGGQAAGSAKVHDCQGDGTDLIPVSLPKTLDQALAEFAVQEVIPERPQDCQDSESSCKDEDLFGDKGG